MKFEDANQQQPVSGKVWQWGIGYGNHGKNELIEAAQISSASARNYYMLNDEKNTGRMSYINNAVTAGDTVDTARMCSETLQVNGTVTPTRATAVGTKSELFDAYAFTLDADRAVYAYGGEGTLALLATDLEFEGSRVKSPVTGSDFNPMGRGDGAYYAEGAFAIRGAKASLLVGEITTGFGNSICNGEAVPTALDLGGSPVHGAFKQPAGECCGKLQPTIKSPSAGAEQKGQECRSRAWYTYPYLTVRMAVSNTTASSLMDDIHAGKYSMAGMQECAIGAWCDRGCCYVQITVPLEDYGLGAMGASSEETSDDLEEYIIRAAGGSDGYFFGGPGAVPIAPPRDPGFDLNEPWRRREWVPFVPAWPGGPNPFEPKPPRRRPDRSSQIWQDAFNHCFMRSCVYVCRGSLISKENWDEMWDIWLYDLLHVDLPLAGIVAGICVFFPPAASAGIWRGWSAYSWATLFDFPYDPFAVERGQCRSCIKACEQRADAYYLRRVPPSEYIHF